VLSGGPIGIMQACLDVVLPYVHERKQFGQSDRRIPADSGQGRRHVHPMNAAAPTSMPWLAACDRGETTRKDAAG
jgi:isovaleryl-CoA dehydrogenase